MEATQTGNKSEIRIEKSWKEKLSDEFEKDYFIQLREFLKSEKERGIKIYPEGNKIFAAFEHTPFKQVKVVIIGQDPYHGDGQANGLSFSVNDHINKPPSLLNIFKELQSDIGIPIPVSGNLSKWSEQGVLLLNATLTVRAGEAASHQNKGWELFTDAVIRKISEELTGVVFLLWGRYAQAKEVLIDHNKHYILKAAHPSPLARGAFFGSKHFSKTNEILINTGRHPVDWNI
ncbi:MAG: uracil-DNA glycosylase [Bacteroidota bacterium]